MRQRIGNGLWSCLLAMLVVGCSDQNSQLKHYIEQVKSMPPSQLAPLPEVGAVDSFEFDSDSVRDPFMPLEKMVSEMQGSDVLSGALQPDYSRVKDAMEFIPLDTFRMVGTVFFQLELWGLVEAFNGQIYRVKVGDHMGLDHGEVIAINEASIELQEIVPATQKGIWVKRKAILEALQ